VCFRRGRPLMVASESQAPVCPLSSRNSTHRPVLILEAGSADLSGRELLARVTDAIAPRQFVSAALQEPATRRRSTGTLLVCARSQRLEPMSSEMPCGATNVPA
jgi:DNA-binding response OmpR family regulator